MPKHKSISQRLKTAGTPALRLQIARDWSQSWQRAHDELTTAFIKRLYALNLHADPDILDDFLTIAALNSKKLAALPNVLTTLGEPTK